MEVNYHPKEINRRESYGSPSRVKIIEIGELSYKTNRYGPLVVIIEGSMTTSWRKYEDCTFADCYLQFKWSLVTKSYSRLSGHELCKLSNKTY